MLLPHLESARRMAALLLVAGLGAGAVAQDTLFAPRLIAEIPAGVELRGPPMRDPNGGQIERSSRVVFAPDGSQVAYVGFKEGRTHAVLGDQVSKRYDFLSRPVFSPNGKHVAFRAGNRLSATKERWWALHNGKRGKSYAWIGAVSVNDNGDLAFWEQPGAKVQKDGAYNRSSQILRLGKRKSKKWQDAWSLYEPRLVGDGKSVVTAAMKGGQWFVLSLGRRGEKKVSKGHGMIESVCVSATGKRIGFVATEASGRPPDPRMPFGKQVVVVDGKRYGHDHDSAGSPVLAPTGKRHAFVFVDKDKMGCAVDTDRAPKATWHMIHSPVFDAKGKRLAYVATQSCKIDPPYRLMTEGWRMAKGGKWVVVTRAVGGKKEETSAEYDAVRNPTFSPDGKHVAFAAKTDGKWRVVCGDAEGEAADELGPLTFSPDGGKIAYGARLGRKLWWKVLELRRQ